MAFRATIFFAGLFVALLSFMGFPQAWDAVLFAVAGGIVMIMAFVGKDRVDEMGVQSAVFVQNRTPRTARARAPRKRETSVTVSRVRSARKSKPADV